MLGPARRGERSPRTSPALPMPVISEASRRNLGMVLSEQGCLHADTDELNLLYL